MQRASTYLGVDIGTTHITALALELATGQIVARAETANCTETTSATDKAWGLSEWDAAAMCQLAWETLCRVVRALPDPACVQGIGCCGQMHGMALMAADGSFLSPFIGWQDRRGEEMIPGQNVSYLQRLAELAGDVPRARMAAGFMGLTLFWWQMQGEPWPPGVRAAFISDAFVAWLTGMPLCTDPSNADSSGLFDARTRHWNAPLIARLGLPEAILPPVRPAPAVAGGLRAELAEIAGLRAGLPVGVSLGDNQASFLGSVADASQSVLLNIGTGGQLSVHVPAFVQDPLLETRCYPGGGYLLVSAGLCGGRAYAVWRDFFRAVGVAFFGARGDEDLYEQMNALAETVPPGAEGVVCEPLFAGTRLEPQRRGSFAGLSTATLTPAHLTRALLEGLIETFAESYARMQWIGVGGRAWLVGSGNGLRRNPLLAQIAARRLGLPLRIPLHEEEAAYGAALLAAVTTGELPGLTAAGRLIRYASPIVPA